MTIYRFDQFGFDSSDGALWGKPNGARATLRPQVARLLVELLEHPGEVLSREELCRVIWDEDRVVDFESGLAAVIKELRRVLADTGGSPELVETVPRRGYRLRVQRVNVEGAGRDRRLLLAAIMAATVILTILAWIVWYSSSTPPAAQTPALAILPFERFGDPDRPPPHAEMLLADTLLARFWELDLDDLELIGRASLRPYTSREDVSAAVAADLNVNLLIEGSLDAAADGWRVQVRMLAVPGGRVVWSENAYWPIDEPLPVGEVADQLLATLAEQWPRIRAEVGGQGIDQGPGG